MTFSLSNYNFRNYTTEQKFTKILEQADNRNSYYKLLIKFIGICMKMGIRMIFENPYGVMSYLKTSFLKVPNFIDEDRTLRGDYFRKPTAYWFWNCEPTHGFSYQKLHKAKSVKRNAKMAKKAGMCSEERSMISPDYARNWICDFVLGKVQNIGQLDMFA